MQIEKENDEWDKVYFENRFMFLKKQGEVTMFRFFLWGKFGIMIVWGNCDD